ncbi:uncharacterized protein LOC100661405 isoform X2 [Loxodonta africana]|uniref:uncharacterized protein LOC100661405 isoform X2 n=1 Tax=Loxodonta africana TaxID=9785 RepID=UPI0030D17B89
MMGAEAARPARNSPRTLFWLRQVQLLLQLLLPLTEAALWPGEAPSAAPPVKERLLLAPSQAPVQLLPPFRLQEGKVDLIENKFCNLLYGQRTAGSKIYSLHEEMLCAGDFSTGKAICRDCFPSPRPLS